MSSKKQYTTIQGRLVALFVVAALLLIPILFFVIMSTRNVVRTAIGQGTAELAFELMELIETGLAGHIDVVLLDARTDVAQAALKRSAATFEALPDAERQALISARDEAWIQGANPAFQEEVLSSTYSQHLLHVFRDFYGVTYGFKLFEEVLVADQYGALVASTQLTSDYRQDDETWWQQARADGVFIGNIDFDVSADAFVLPIGIAVEDADGEFLGVYKVGIAIDEVVQAVSRSSRRLGVGDIRLVDRNNRLIFSSQAYDFLQNLSDDPFVRAWSSRESGENFILLPFQGTLNVVAGAESTGHRHLRETGWTVLVRNGVTLGNPAFRQSLITERAMIAFGLVVFLAGVLATFIVARTVTRPIDRLTRAVDVYAAGDLDQPIADTLLQRKDEVGLLARSFERMRSGLSDLTRSLEQKVEERTQALQVREREAQARVRELDRLNKLMIGRELKMAELKKRVKPEVQQNTPTEPGA